MKLDFSLGEIDQLWNEGALPAMLKETKGRSVKVQLSGKSDSPLPPSIVPIGDLLSSERPSPLQHAVTLLLSYPHSLTPAPSVREENGWWTIPGSTIYGQIRIPLTTESIALIEEADGEGFQFELKLNDIDLSNKTPKRAAMTKSPSEE
jgi:hypothetical protein